MNLPFAEDIGHYWKTGERSPEKWMDLTCKLIEDLGGTVAAEGFGRTEEQAAYMLTFEIGEDKFRVVWPVLPSRTGQAAAARRQAATLLHHDIKAKAMTSSVLGAKAAFFSYVLLADGRAASSLAAPELAQAFPFQLK